MSIDIEILIFLLICFPEAGGAVAGDLLDGSADESGDVARNDLQELGRVNLEILQSKSVTVTPWDIGKVSL